MKILVVIASYGNKNDAYLSEIVRQYRQMRHHVDIVLCRRHEERFQRGGLTGIVTAYGDQILHEKLA